MDEGGRAVTQRQWCRGEAHPMTKFPDAVVHEILSMRAHQKSYREIIRELLARVPPVKVSYITVRRVCTRKSRKAVTP